jgi:hypothetical protein
MDLRETARREPRKKGGLHFGQWSPGFRFRFRFRCGQESRLFTDNHRMHLFFPMGDVVVWFARLGDVEGG